MKTIFCFGIVAVCSFLTWSNAAAWQIPFCQFSRAPSLLPTNTNDRKMNTSPACPSEDLHVASAGRRHAWKQLMLSSATIIATATGITSENQRAEALVKGVSPPEKSRPSERPKCSNIQECQELAERKEVEEREEALKQQLPSQVTAGGTRYRDIEEGPAGSAMAKEGDEVTVAYKVLKLGKRSYDGLSGEGTLIFSRGYGLEDDEVNAGNNSPTKAFSTILGSYNNIDAFNDAVVGMKESSVRRFSVLPQKGWRRPGRDCDGGPGGTGAGGEVKTDYGVVPTAKVVELETCFDTTKLPFPVTFAQQRRMAQRFDQSLIMEVKLLSVKSASNGF